MPRPRTRTRSEIVAAAKDVFWERGYDGAPLSELERRTGINRSSLYAEFGSKQELFSEALDLYYAEVVDPLVGQLESDGNIAAIASFFDGVRRVILEDGAATRRGCLLVNTIATMSPDERSATSRGVEFRDRLANAFGRALQRANGGLDPASKQRRAEMLLATTLGIWVCARIDLVEAAAMCSRIAEEVRNWAVA
jgi:TetR/AcrR family transcriptional regulator, transcriptional repressor for nem operon